MRASVLFSSVLLAATLLSAVSASASDLTISVEVPALDVAEYHKPYVSIWIENEKGESTNLAVWYGHPPVLPSARFDESGHRP